MKTRIFAPDLPMSLNDLKLCFVGSQSNASGLCSSGATTDTVGNCLLKRIASSVCTRPRSISGSWYMID